MISNAPPSGSGGVGTVLLLLNLDLVLLLLLGLLIARRVVQIVVERRRGLAGSRLHGQLVALFSIVAVTPAIIVSIFSVLFLSAGLETWFSERIRTALQNSLNVAEAYLEEHREVIRADALAMAADLNREGPLLLDDPAALQRFMSTQAALRSLTEAIIFDSTGTVLARTGLSFTLEVERVPSEALLEAAGGEVVTLTSDAEDRVRALVRLYGFGDAYLFVGRFVDPSVLGFMARTQEVVSEYQRMESERWDIQITSALLFAIVALLLLLAAVGIGINFADRLAAPISQLIVGANRVRAGDLTTRVPEDETDDDIIVLARAFNRMTGQLASQRRELIEANEQIDERRRFTEAVLAGVTTGVLGLDADRRIVLPNRRAREFFATLVDDIDEVPLTEILPETAALFERLAHDPLSPVEDQLSITAGERERTLLVRLSAQFSSRRIVGFVLTFDDITTLLSAQRQAAWSEVARRIAHEIKNPLTPIRLSAERLKRRYLGQITSERDSFSRSITTIVTQVDTIGRLIQEFSAFARMPEAVLRPEALREIVHQAVSLQQSGYGQIDIRTSFPPSAPETLVCDAGKVTQALNNLLQNAIQALLEQERAAAAVPPAIVVRVIGDGEETVIAVEDNGPGLPPSERHRLLEPYVTTRESGTGLGLAIVHKIMEEHGGRVELDASEQGGARARLVFPMRRRKNRETPSGREEAATAAPPVMQRSYGTR